MDESRLFPLLAILLVWLIRTASKNKKKAANRTPSRKPSEAFSDPASAARTPAHGKAAVSDISSGLDAQMAKEFPHLFRSGQSPASVSGSLHAESTEGRDPCHDDYGSLPSGSLRAESTEGHDPCHDGWAPPAAAEDPVETGAGLNLSWAGSDIVKGFIYGEILNRKVG